MDSITWIILVGAVVVLLLLKRLTLVSPTTAREWLRKDALVIDVRSEGEFRARHLADAINIPLDQLQDEIVRRAPNKDRALLLHCLSGTRSGMAKALLKKLGYRNVFNLGSRGRAERILRLPSQDRKGV